MADLPPGRLTIRRSAHAPTVGGGDYEIFEHPRTTGHTVTSAADTLQQVEALLLS